MYEKILAIISTNYHYAASARCLYKITVMGYCSQQL